jgi:hypothetical protein
MNYAWTVPLDDKLSWGGDAGLRGLISNYEWNQFLIRPNVTYRFNYPVSVQGAMAWFSTMNRGVPNVNEFRLHQDLNFKWPDFGWVEFFWRLRVEERWFFYQYTELPNDFKVRVRYLLGLETTDLSFLGSKRPIYFISILEGFKTISGEEAAEVFINQTRLHFAIGHRVSPTFTWEFHYIRQASREGEDQGLEVSQNIYRIRTFHRILKKKKSEEGQ